MYIFSYNIASDFSLPRAERSEQLRLKLQQTMAHPSAPIYGVLRLRMITISLGAAMNTRKGITRDGAFFNIGLLILPLLAAATQTSSIIGRRRQRLLTTDITRSKAPASIGQTFESLWITITRSRGDVRQFQIKLERPGARSRYGVLERHDIVPTTVLQELRRSYEGQLQIMHDL